MEKAMTFATLIYETAGRIARISLNRPERLNTIVLPELEAEGIRFLRRCQWSDSQQAWLKSVEQAPTGEA